MSKFNTDLKQEQILSQFLDNIYKSKGISFERVVDLNKQHQGIDLIINHNSLQYFVDEKSQLHYINSDLPTFTFELSYLNRDGFLREGWLFESSKLTQFYFLITGIFLYNDKKYLTNSNDIQTLKITSVNRKKLLCHLSKIGLSEEILLGYDSGLRTNNSYGSNKIPELNPTCEGLIYYTNHLKEKPINLQLRLNYLIKNKIAKEFYYV